MKTKFVVLVTGMMLLSLILAACGNASSAPSNFPTGKFILPGNEFEGIQFNADGTWYAFYYGEHVAEGTYSVNEDLYTEETSNQDCGKSPMSFRYTFDGTNLKFDLTDESNNDTCENRRQSFDGVTYVLSK